MIQVDRNRVDENGVLIKPNQAWFATAAQKTTEAETEGTAHQTTDYYKHQQVKAALRKLFYDKCAYCEKSILDSIWDVEHYRPKGRVAKRPKHPGYYWLAYSWMNLLPSCQRCNRRLTDPPRWGDMVVGVAAGKLDQFPLSDETTRVMAHDDLRLLSDEATLLLNPTLEDPKPHLGYGVDGTIFSEQNSEKGQTTIEICHLSRRDLCDRRRDKITQILMLIMKVDDVHLGDANAISAAIDDLKQYFTAPEREFSAAAKYLFEHPAKFGL